MLVTARSATRARIRTDYREKTEVEVASKDTCREFSQEALEKTSNGMWIPILIRSEKIDIAL